MYLFFCWLPEMVNKDEYFALFRLNTEVIFVAYYYQLLLLSH